MCEFQYYIKRLNKIKSWVPHGSSSYIIFQVAHFRFLIIGYTKNYYQSKLKQANVKNVS